MNVTKRDNTRQELDLAKIRRAVEWACEGIEDIDPMRIEMGAKIQFYDGIKTSEIQNAMVLSAQRLISETTPNYTFPAARLMLMNIYQEAGATSENYLHLRDVLARAHDNKRINPELLTFDLDVLNAVIDKERDKSFELLGLITMYDRYLLRTAASHNDKGDIIELPQHFLMRVAMGLCLNYPPEERTKKAIQFYNQYSTLEFLSSTPTLFNSGTPFSQMSSCYGNTVEDDLVNKGGIFDKITECARLSKFAGGIGTDWHKVRAADSPIHSTNGLSSGIVPFLKVFNDTSVAVNQGGKRKGAFSAYIEPHHADAPDFMTLKRNAGDERRRAHDIFPAWWLNDLLFERYEQDGMWSYFDPKEVPELHELHGEAFKKAYEEAEAKGLARKQVKASELMREMVLSLMDTGAPWFTFKDEHNRRNPQQHIGVIHNTNLCTEISLNNTADETFVCNLGSINLSKFVVNGKIDMTKLADAVRTGIEMLDNVIDLNYYPSEESRRSNLRHRPIGLGVMGYAEALNMCGIDYESQEHLEWAHAVFECISFNAILMSCELAQKYGAYETFNGSLWSKGILTPKTSKDAAKALVERQISEEDWNWLSELVMKHGLRNCNLLAVAPTATIANIAGTTPCTELPIQPTYLKANLSGTFKFVDPSMRHNPSLCKYAYDIDQEWAIKAAAVRQIFVDQAQSLNLFRRKELKGRDVLGWYILAWRLGLKSTYYLKNQKRNSDAKKAGEK